MAKQEQINNPTNAGEEERIASTGVTHESVNCEGGVDYDKLIEQFGCQRITEELLLRFEAARQGRGGPLHPLLKRGMFYSHKDLDLVLKEYEEGKPFYLYTGRGPSSSSMHLGHLLPFLFTKVLQDAFDVPVVIQMTDDEKFLYKELSLEQIRFNLIENVKDIIACGFNPKKTFIFSNYEYMGTLYPNIVRIQRLVTNNQVKAIFGTTMSDNIGKTAFPAVQASPSFVSSFPVVMSQDTEQRPGFVRRCLVPCGIDQDPFFRMTRDVAVRMGEGYIKPALMHSKFFPALQGIDKKMSASDPSSAIFLTDSAELIEDKITRLAFSGGQMTKKEHQRLGGNTDVDIAFQYLRFFLDDDAELKRLEEGYRAGTVLSGEMKRKCIAVLTEVVRKHQVARAEITEETVREFMTARPLDLSFQS